MVRRWYLVQTARAGLRLWRESRSKSGPRCGVDRNPLACRSWFGPTTNRTANGSERAPKFLELPREYGVIEPAEERLTHGRRQLVERGYSLHGRSQGLDFDVAEALFFEIKAEQRRRYRARVGRVEVEMCGEAGQALGIGRLDGHQ